MPLPVFKCFLSEVNIKYLYLMVCLFNIRPISTIHVLALQGTRHGTTRDISFRKSVKFGRIDIVRFTRASPIRMSLISDLSLASQFRRVGNT